MTRRNQAISAVAVLVLLALMVGCGGQASLSNLGARELFDLGMAKYNDGKYRSAIEYFQAIIYDYPGESLVDTAQYYLALTYYGNEEYILSQVEFNRLVNYYPSSVYVPHATFMRAVSYFEATPNHHGLDQSDLKEALRLFEDFIIDYPQSELLGDAQTYIRKSLTRLAQKDYDAATTYFRMNALEAARKYYQRVIDEYTGSDFAASSLYQVAEIDRKLHNFDEARRQFVAFMTVYPEHELTVKASEKIVESAFKAAEASYAKGELQEAKGKFEAFIVEYPDSKRVEKAREFLTRIGEIPVEAEAEQAVQES